MNIDEELNNASYEVLSFAWAIEHPEARLAAFSAILPATLPARFSAARAAYNASSYKEQLEQVRIIKEVL